MNKNEIINYGDSMKHVYKVVMAVFIASFTTAAISYSYFRLSYSPACYEYILPVISPDNSEEVLKLIDSAKYEIKLEVYEFSSKELADKLIEAGDRGVDVHVILEQSVYQNSGMFDYLLNNGIDVAWAPERFNNVHSKFAVVDDSIVLVGSLNWSKNALLYNREASVIIYSQDVARQFEAVFDTDVAS